MASPNGSFRLGWFALDLGSDVPTALVPHDDFVSVLIAAGIKNILHFGAELRGIAEGVEFPDVDQASHLNRLRKHVHDFKMRLDDFLGLRQGRNRLRAGS